MRSLSDRDLRALRHPDEDARFYLALFFVGPVIAAAMFGIARFWIYPFFVMEFWEAIDYVQLWVLIALGIVAVVILVDLIHMLLYEALLSGAAAEITHEALPELEQAVSLTCAALDYPRDVIRAFLVSEEKYGAILFHRFWRDLLLVKAKVAEAAFQFDAPGELAFTVAAHVGAARARFTRQYFIRQSLDFVVRFPGLSLLVLPYLRAVQYTSDQISLAATGDLQTALDALSAGIVGKDLASTVALLGWLEQHDRRRWSFVSFLRRAAWAHPFPVDRIANLLCFARVSFPEQFEQILNSIPPMHRTRAIEILDRSRHAR